MTVVLSSCTAGAVVFLRDSQSRLPSGNVLKTVTCDVGKTFLFNIPKVAAVSLEHDFSETVGLRSFERHGMCYKVASEMNADSVVDIMRHPKAHVLSMFNHCTASSLADRNSSRPGFPRSIAVWLKRWAQMQDDGGYRQGGGIPTRTMPMQCYNRINMQTHCRACNVHFPDNYSAELSRRPSDQRSRRASGSTVSRDSYRAASFSRVNTRPSRTSTGRRMLPGGVASAGARSCRQAATVS